MRRGSSHVPRRSARDPLSLQAIGDPPVPSLTLSEVLQEAVTWQEEAEEVIARCAEPGGKSQVLARRGAQVATVYRILRETLRQVPPSPIRDEADGLLNHHQQLIEQALLLGFRPSTVHRERIAAHLRGGLGDAGLRLRILRWRTAGPTLRP